MEAKELARISSNLKDNPKYYPNFKDYMKLIFSRNVSPREMNITEVYNKGELNGLTINPNYYDIPSNFHKIPHNVDMNELPCFFARSTLCRHAEVFNLKDIENNIGAVVKCSICEKTIDPLSVYIDYRILKSFLLDPNANAFGVPNISKSIIDIEIIRTYSDKEIYDAKIKANRENKAQTFATQKLIGAPLNIPPIKFESHAYWLQPFSISSETARFRFILKSLYSSPINKVFLENLLINISLLLCLISCF